MEFFRFFAKKSDKKFVFLEKKEIVQKRKMSQVFQREVRGNRTEITVGKVCLRKTEKNRFSRNFRRIFYKIFGERVFCLEHRKHQSNISADARGFIEKFDF